MKKKAIVAVVALVLVLCCAMGGTLAWLVDSTTEVKNTFTYGDINISLWEHKLNEDGLTLSDDVFTGAKQTGFKMIPGNKIEKDPTVTVEADSEACWLFVKVEKSSNFDNFMTYDIDTKWTELDAVNHPGVYYYNEDELDSLLTKDKEFYVLKDNKVTVLSEVTKGDFAAFDKDQNGTLSEIEKEALPTLTFTAYAVQKDGFNTADLAWAEINK